MKKRNLLLSNLAIFGSSCLAVWLFFLAEFLGFEFWIFDGGESTSIYLAMAIIASVVCLGLFLYYWSRQTRLQKEGVITLGTLSRVASISKHGKTPCDIEYTHGDQNLKTRVDISHDDIAQLEAGAKWKLVVDPKNPSKTAAYIDLFCDQNSNIEL